MRDMEQGECEEKVKGDEEGNGKTKNIFFATSQILSESENTSRHFLISSNTG